MYVPPLIGAPGYSKLWISISKFVNAASALLIRSNICTYPGSS